MVINHGLLSVEERAKEICRLQKEQINKKELRKKYKCGVATSNLVYKLKGWTVDRSALAKENLKLSPNHRKHIPGSKWLRMAWR